jgi:hypothetical protein
MGSVDFRHVLQQNTRYNKHFEEAGIKTYDDFAEHYKTLVGNGLWNDGKFPDQDAYDRWYEQTDLKSDKNLDTLEELKVATRDLMWEGDKRWEEYQRDPYKSDRELTKSEEERIEITSDPDEQEAKAPPPVDKSDEQPGAGPPAHPATGEQWEQWFRDTFYAPEQDESAGAAGAGADSSIWERAKAAKDQPIAEAREQAGADAAAPAYSPKDMAADVGAAADAGAPADAGAGADEDQRPEGFSDSSSDASSATERGVAPLLGFEEAPKAAAQLPRDEDRDLTGGDPEEVSNTVDKEPVDVPDAPGAAVSGVAVGAGGAAVDAGAIGDKAGTPGETIEDDDAAGVAGGDAAGEAILVDPPFEAAEDESFGTLELGAEDETSDGFAGEWEVDTTTRIPDITATGSPSEPVDPLGETGKEDAGDRLEEAEGDDPVNPDSWAAGAAPASLYQGPTESLGYQPSPAELKASGFDVDERFVDLHPATVGYQDDSSSIPEDLLLNPYEDDTVVDL